MSPNNSNYCRFFVVVVIGHESINKLLLIQARILFPTYIFVASVRKVEGENSHTLVLYLNPEPLRAHKRPA